MPSCKITKLISLNPQEIFNIIIDIESYPKFLPWCTNSKIISTEENIIIAELTISHLGYTEKFISEVKTYIMDNKYEIEVKAISGPFKYLINSWKIVEIDNKSCVDFFIDFEFKNFIFNKLFNPFFKKAVAKIADSFQQRAKYFSI